MLLSPIANKGVVKVLELKLINASNIPYIQHSYQKTFQAFYRV